MKFSPRKQKTISSTYMRQTQTEGWFKRNQYIAEFWFTSLTLLMTFGALIVSITVMRHQDTLARENNETQKEQFEFAKLQYEYSEKQRKEYDRIDSAHYEFQKFKDSIKFIKEIEFYQKQVNNLETQIDMQKHMQDVQMNIEEPKLAFDSAYTTFDTTLFVNFSNIGKRGMVIESILMGDLISFIDLTDHIDSMIVDTLRLLANYHLLPGESIWIPFRGFDDSDEDYYYYRDNNNNQYVFLTFTWIDVVTKIKMIDTRIVAFLELPEKPNYKCLAYCLKGEKDVTTVSKYIADQEREIEEIRKKYNIR